MGTVHLTRGHHHLYIRDQEISFSNRVLLSSELLARPIMGVGPVAPLKETTQNMIRAALQALMDLPKFNAAVSYGLVEKGGIHIIVPSREWGEITLGFPYNVVVGFSHDTRHQNLPFRKIWQWLEEEGPAYELSEEEFARFAEGWSSPARWRNFFENRIRREAEALKEQAHSHRKKADGMMAQVGAIQAALA